MIGTGSPIDETTKEWPCSCAPRDTPKPSARLRDIYATHPMVMEAAAEIDRLKADHLSALKLSREWMAKHDRLLGFIQARPEMLKELFVEDAKARAKP